MFFKRVRVCACFCAILKTIWTIATHTCSEFQKHPCSTQDIPTATERTTSSEPHVDLLVSFFPQRAPLALYGLSELPLKQRLLLYQAGENFSFFRDVLQELSFSIFRLCAMYEKYLYCSTANTTQHSHKASTCRSECDNASNQTESIYSTVPGTVCMAVPQAQHGTAQSARTKPRSKYVLIRVRKRKQADRVGESQHMSSIYTAR